MKVRNRMRADQQTFNAEGAEWENAEGRRAGHILLAFVLLICVVAMIWIGIKIIDKIQSKPPDIWHGNDTNIISLVDVPFTDQMSALRAALPGNPLVSVTITQAELAVTVEVPLAALAYEWSYAVQQSSNLLDWTVTDLGWAEAVERVRTNHTEAMRFYRRVLAW